MLDPHAEMLRQGLECEGLLGCFHGLTDLDQSCVGTLADSREPLTVDNMAGEVDRERSTVYRSVERLKEADFVHREQRNYEDRGYYHVYRSADPDNTGDDLQRLLNDWYIQLDQLIYEFRAADAKGVEAADGEGDADPDPVSDSELAHGSNLAHDSERAPSRTEPGRGPGP